jgi:hypothetical protein
MQVADELKTFAAFEGKVAGNTIQGISLIQEGPALGHGVYVDRKALGQFKALASSKGKLKAKMNHFSALESTVGYYENFRISKGKLLADLSIFDSFSGRDALLEMIEKIPSEFGVSLMFKALEPELNSADGKFYTRANDIYSADFVDTPAANRDGVFSVAIDNDEQVMVEPEKPQAPEAPSFVSEFSALSEKIEQLSAQMAAYETKLASECEKIAADIKAFAEKPAADLELQARLAAAAPAPAAFSAPVNEQEAPAPVIAFADAKKSALEGKVGLERIKAARAFSERFPSESSYLSVQS